ncbi:leucine-rich melanocyte differentiation-associated protein [Brachyhypopomus gauderio]|uniref:leucine-rich melanocyte differentiation-associated protein n=1 Tax=Brachyhypopomus gauderio TaxID=698409 RepID=UPI004042BE99
MALSESVVVNGSQVSYIGHDCEVIPDFLAAKYGSFARRLDLSFNRLRGGPRRTQEDPGGHRRTQEDTGGPRRTQEDPGGHRRTQEDPGGPRRTQADPGGPRQTQADPGRLPRYVVLTADVYWRTHLPQ